MQTFEMTCPGCGKSLRIPEESLGKRGTCSHCNTEFIASPMDPPEFIVTSTGPSESKDRSSTPATPAPNGTAQHSNESERQSRLAVYSLLSVAVVFSLIVLVWLGTRDTSTSSRTPRSPRTQERETVTHRFIPQVGDAFIVGAAGHEYPVMRVRDWGSTKEAFVRNFSFYVYKGDKARVLDTDSFMTQIRIESDDNRNGAIGWIPREGMEDAKEAPFIAEPAKPKQTRPTEAEQKKIRIFQDLVREQDKGDDVAAYRIIANRYDMTEEQVRQLVIEGMEKNWPFPDLAH